MNIGTDFMFYLATLTDPISFTPRTGKMYLEKSTKYISKTRLYVEIYISPVQQFDPGFVIGIVPVTAEHPQNVRYFSVISTWNDRSYVQVPRPSGYRQ